MHTQYVTIDEDIKFPKVSSAKEMPEKVWKLNTLGD
jgi:hypothetical protein